MKQPKTFVYKTVEGRQGKKVEILLDIHLPESSFTTSSSPSPPKPLFWIHFGGFIQGSRTFLPPHFKRACDRLNLALISPDYRLTPQVQLQDCLEDVHDSIRFTLSAKDGVNAKLSENNLPVLDTSQYILSGSSAGGWAALLQGLGFIGNDDIPFSPLAILALSSVTTVNPDRAPYYHTPIKPLPWKYDWPIESDVKVGDQIPLEPLKDHLDSNGDILSEASFEKYPERGPVYSYARQEGIYPDIVLGQKTNPRRQSAERFCVPSLIEKSLNEQKLRQTKLVFIDYGEKDIMVETDQSKQVIKALQSYKNLPFELATHIKQGQGHIWDIVDSEADIPEMWQKVERLLQ